MALFSAWAATADGVRATTKKLEKLAILGAYLTSLDDADLEIASRLFAGTPFGASDERVLSVGWSALTAAILERSGKDGDALGASYRKHADLGDVAYDLIDAGPAGSDEGPRRGVAGSATDLTLSGVAAAFDAIAAARGTTAKRALLRELLARADRRSARYLVKIVSGEPRIGLRATLLEDAIARAFGTSDGLRALVARAHMLTGDIGRTAVLARRDELGSAALELFAPIGVMLATPVLDLAEVEKRFPAPYVVEDKYDGLRVQVHKAGDRVELFSRTNDRITHRFPEVLQSLVAIPGSVVLDAEVLGLKNSRAIPFTRFQARLGRKAVSEELQAELPATLVAFDVLERDGDVLLDRPLASRKEVLASLPLRAPAIFARSMTLDLSGEALVSALDAEFAASRERGNEGLMVKDPRSPYRPGRRGMEWLKVKRALRTLDVVVTAVEWGHGKRAGVLSDYTFAVRDGDRLLEVGKAYSGLTDVEIAEMTKHFLSITTSDEGWRRVVRPEIVIEVAFDQIQRSSRHSSGYALRFPRIVRLRPDKPVRDVDTLDTVRAVAEGLEASA